MVHRPAEVAQDHVAGLDHAAAGLVVRAGAVRAAGDDGEVGALVPGVEDALDQLPVHVRLGAPGEPPPAHLAGDGVDRVRGGPQRIDLGRVLHDAERPRDLARLPEPGARARAACRSSTNRAHV